MKITNEQLFLRQTTLVEIGKSGQKLLQSAKVLVIGCGGLGSPVAVYLASSGIGSIHLVDFDVVSASNLHRQVFYSMDDIGKYKAEILCKFLQQRAPFTEVSFSNQAVDKNNIIDLIAEFDIIVDGTDNLGVKYLINDACVLVKKPLVYGSLYKFDGYVSSFNILKDDGSYSCNLRDAFPKMATDIPNCEEAGTLNPIVGTIALLQVNEVIKFITKTGIMLADQLLIYNTLENSHFKIKLKKNESIHVESIFKESTYLIDPCATQNSSLLISANELREKLKLNEAIIVSVINNVETEIPFRVNQKEPLSTFDIEEFDVDLNKEYIIVCNRGITSYDVTLKLKEKYPELAVLSLSEGINNYH